MAKDQDVKQATPNAQGSPGEPVVEKQPVEKQEALHKEASNPQAALQPGHDLVVAAGLAGEIEKLANDLSSKGQAQAAADLVFLSNSISALINALNELNKNPISDEVKPIYEKILNFFNK